MELGQVTDEEPLPAPRVLLAARFRSRGAVLELPVEAQGGPEYLAELIYALGSVHSVHASCAPETEFVEDFANWDDALAIEGPWQISQDNTNGVD